MMNRRSVMALGGASALATWMGLPGMALAQEQEGPLVRDMVLGSPDAKVTVVEYASFTCPHCATFHENTFKKLRDNYIDTGKVRFVFREAYFDRFGLWASMVARCGGEQRFFGMTDLILSKQREWTQGGPAEIAQALRQLGLSAGLTGEQLDACFKDEDKAKALYTWYEGNFQADGITGTPAFMIDGEQHPNMGYEDFAKILDAKLAQ